MMGCMPGRNFSSISSDSGCMPACDGALDHLRRLGDEHALFGFELVSQLHLRQARVCVKAGVVYSADVDDHEPFFLFGVA